MHIKAQLQKRWSDKKVAAQHFEQLLVEYQESGHAPPNLFGELAASGDDGDQKFWAIVWESLLFNHLKKIGCSFTASRVKKSGQKGPDFCITHSNKKIWIEAIATNSKGILAEYLAPRPTTLKIQ